MYGYQIWSVETLTVYCTAKIEGNAGLNWGHQGVIFPRIVRWLLNMVEELTPDQCVVHLRDH